jgi:chromosomal replication initiator protein
MKNEVSRIVDAVAQHASLTREQVLAGGRWRSERRLAMYLAKQLTRRSFRQIGNDFGGIDHTVVVHGYHTIRGMMEKDPVFAAKVEKLTAELGGDTDSALVGERLSRATGCPFP